MLNMHFLLYIFVIMIRLNRLFVPAVAGAFALVPFFSSCSTSSSSGTDDDDSVVSFEDGQNLLGSSSSGEVPDGGQG